MKKIIIGLGSGRCGTKSLADLLNSQYDASVTHENNGKNILPWIVNHLKFEEYYKNIVNRENEFVGDVSFYSLPYIHSYFLKDSNTKFVILKREKEQTIKSLLKKTYSRNHWMNHNGNDWSFCRWDTCFPKFNASSKEEAVEIYYDYYYNLCENIPSENCFWINTDDLNNKNICIDMLNFCGFKNPDFISFKKNRLLT